MPVTTVLLNTGRRGLYVYETYALKIKNKLNVVAVAEPIKIVSEKFANLHRIPSNNCYKT